MGASADMSRMSASTSVVKSVRPVVMRAVAKPPAKAPTALMRRCVGYVQNGAT
jgi:hypothetical protein